jgi:hypothetical protein
MHDGRPAPGEYGVIVELLELAPLHVRQAYKVAWADLVGKNPDIYSIENEDRLMLLA